MHCSIAITITGLSSNLITAYWAIGSGRVMCSPDLPFPIFVNRDDGHHRQAVPLDDEVLLIPQTAPDDFPALPVHLGGGDGCHRFHTFPW
jgi:hypothetical protein